MPVVTGGGIVGRVITVSPWSSQVMLITDEKAGAGAVVGQLGQSGALGSVRGRADLGVALIEMRYVSGLEKVEVGDSVMTTGQDGIYPPGLNVGRVVDVKNGTATQAHQILIQPGAQLDQLEEVAVLLYQPPPRLCPNRPPECRKTEEMKILPIANCRLPIGSVEITVARVISNARIHKSAIGNWQLAMFLCRSLRLP